MLSRPWLRPDPTGEAYSAPQISQLDLEAAYWRRGEGRSIKGGTKEKGRGGADNWLPIWWVGSVVQEMRLSQGILGWLCPWSIGAYPSMVLSRVLKF